MWIWVIVDATAAIFASFCVIALFSVSIDIVFDSEHLKENPFCLIIKRIINKKS